MKDYYKILGIRKNASMKSVKDAYRNKAKILHPDKGGDSEEFKELLEAHQEIKDQKKRDHYDKYGMKLSDFEHVVGKILGVIISADMKDFILDPLELLTKIEEEIKEKDANLKVKLVMLKDDIRELKSKKDFDIELVIRALEKTVLVCEHTLKDLEIKDRACEIVRKHFTKAKDLLNRRKVEECQVGKVTFWPAATTTDY